MLAGVLPDEGLNDSHVELAVAVHCNVPVPLLLTCTDRAAVGLAAFGSTVNVNTVGVSDNTAGCEAATIKVTLTLAELFAPVTVTCP
jgi:hypothetical protein